MISNVGPVKGLDMSFIKSQRKRHWVHLPYLEKVISDILVALVILIKGSCCD